MFLYEEDELFKCLSIIHSGLGTIKCTAVASLAQGLDCRASAEELLYEYALQPARKNAGKKAV
jgi:hypothetical protein